MPASNQAYKIQIANSNSGNLAPNDGFIDNLRIEDYAPSLETTPSGLTLALSQAKRRGNLRYRDIIDQLGLVANCYVDPRTLPTASTSTGNAITMPTSFGFQIYVERSDCLLTHDELNVGQTLSGINCIKRCIARALIANNFRVVDVYDPTPAVSTGTWGATASLPRFGHHVNPASQFAVGAYATSIVQAEGMVTVTVI